MTVPATHRIATQVQAKRRLQVPAPLGQSVELLWLIEPKRSTCLAKVTDVRGNQFQVDRCLFAPTSRSHRHPQPADGGTVWLGGEKRRVEHVAWREGGLWLTLRGAGPELGAKLQCELDADRRLAMSCAHTAMHLVLAALWREPGAVLAADPHVKGGGTFRIETVDRLAPERLAAALRQANDWAKANLDVERLAVARDEAVHRLDAQRFQPPDPFPGPTDVLHAARIGTACTFSCDGTHVDATRRIGRVVLASVGARRGGGMVVVGRVAPA